MPTSYFPASNPSRIPDSDGEPAVRPQRKNQRQRILELLISAGGTEVPSPELARVSLQYCARIAELRDEGFVIISRVEIHSGMKRGFFRLHQSPAFQTDTGSLK
jgi:hypothetical protein